MGLWIKPANPPDDTSNIWTPPAFAFNTKEFMKTISVKIPIDKLWAIFSLVRRINEDTKYNDTLNDGTALYYVDARMYNDEPEKFKALETALYNAYGEVLRKGYC